VPENRKRFARLAILYGWVQAGDHQFIYQQSSPELVYSVDHGHFFPGGPKWQATNLTGATAAEPDQQLASGCNLTPEELREAAAGLSCISEAMIERIVASPRDEWGITQADRLALVRYLIRRRDELRAVLGA